jgi:Spy/CpxP family protein refolding chaperone
MKKIIGYSILSLLLTVTLAAQPFGNKGGNFQSGRIIDALKLTPDQEKQFKDIQYERQKKTIDLSSQIHKNRLEIRHMLSNNKVDDKKLLELTNANSKIQTEIKENAVQSWLSIYKILQPEQQEIWTKHFGRMGQVFSERMKDRIHQKMDGKRPMRMNKFDDSRSMGMQNQDDDEFIGMQFMED